MGFVRLCVLSGTMFISSTLASIRQCVTKADRSRFTALVIGNLPLSLSSSLSQLRIRQISLYGVGLLVGASLTIIIPEGVDAVYESAGYDSGEGKGGGHSHEVKSGLVGVALISGFLLMCVGLPKVTPRRLMRALQVPDRPAASVTYRRQGTSIIKPELELSRPRLFEAPPLRLLFPPSPRPRLIHRLQTTQCIKSPRRCSLACPGSTVERLARCCRVVESRRVGHD